MISSGMLAMGQGGAGLRSVGGGSPRIEVVEYSLMRVCKEVDRPCREWWAVLGTVAEALEGLGSWVLEAGAVTGAADADADADAEAAACCALSFLK